ncbi:hypothetical protein K0651_01880 [Ornithinimicrobium sp. Arc0846-15]|nr:hypothetical protein [Ornithinimicrobium laminariae]
MSDLMVTIAGVRYRREDAITQNLLTKDGKMTSAAAKSHKDHAAAQKRRNVKVARGRPTRTRAAEDAEKAAADSQTDPEQQGAGKNEDPPKQ